jgi:hypothetical protein
LFWVRVEAALWQLKQNPVPPDSVGLVVLHVAFAKRSM